MKHRYLVFGLVLMAALCSGCFIEHDYMSLGATGVVLDAQTRLPVCGAKAFISHSSGPRASLSATPTNGTTRVVTTDTNGLFSIPPVQEWTVIIIMGDVLPPANILWVMRDGYDPGVIDLLKAQQTGFIEVLLHQSAK